MFENLKQDLINKQVKDLLESRNLNNIVCLLDENNNVCFEFNEEPTHRQTIKDHETQVNYIAYLREEIKKLKNQINQINTPTK